MTRAELLWAVATKPFPVLVILTVIGACVGAAIAERVTR